MAAHYRSRHDLVFFLGLLFLGICRVQSFQGKRPFIIRCFVKSPSVHSGVKIYSRPRDFGGGSSLEQEVMVWFLFRCYRTIKLILSNEILLR